MCLILVAVDQHPDYPLILCGNRDEFYKRPTKQADYWNEDDRMFAGKDLEKGGTWLGVTTKGRMAVVTNVRERHDVEQAYFSRGELVADFLKQEVTPSDFIYELKMKELFYQGYNLIVGQKNRLFYASNRVASPVELNQGIHVVSNAQLNSSWPKTERLKETFENSLNQFKSETDLIGDLIQQLRDETTYQEELLPDTGFGRDLERRLSPIFIKGEDYGTRASTILLFRKDGTVRFIEQSYGPNALLIGRKDQVIYTEQ